MRKALRASGPAVEVGWGEGQPQSADVPLRSRVSTSGHQS